MISVTVVAKTIFLGVPDSLGMPKNTQDKGSDGARLVECAGRTCYDSFGVGRDSASYHTHIKEVGHGSVTEHASLSFFITGISRGCSHELVRHRAGTAISQRSTRYVDENESEWCWHPLLMEYWRHYYSAVAGGEGYVDCKTVESMAKRQYLSIVSNLESWLIGKGIDKATARKQARGAARGLLGNALSTEMVWTANVRAIRNVLEQRASQHADAEIRVLANKIYECAMVHIPEYFNDYVKGECPDGIGYSLSTQYRKI